MREQMEAMAEPSYFAQIRQQLAELGSSARIQAQLATVVGSCGELIDSSVLAKYFAATGARESTTSVIDAEIFEGIDV